jgi:hypothetical protein
MATKTVTINEALSWMKTLRARQAELIALRDENSHTITRRYGLGGDKEKTTEPVYDVKALDKMITRVQREVRVLDQAIKATNAVTLVNGYEQDDDVLGELS